MYKVNYLNFFRKEFNAKEEFFICFFKNCNTSEQNVYFLMNNSVENYNVFTMVIMNEIMYELFYNQ